MSLEQKLLTALSGLVASQADEKWIKADTGITWDQESTGITLPASPSPMSLKAAIETLVRINREESRWIRVSETIDGHHLEALYAFNQALKNLHGFAQSINKEMGPFQIPSSYISIQTSLNTWERVPFGDFKIPGLSQTVTAYFSGTPSVLKIEAEVMKKEEGLLAALAEETRRILRDNSLYHRKALKITHDEEGELNSDIPPTFIDLSSVDEGELILNESTRYHVETNIFAPIRHTDEIKRRGRSVKRGVLLYGNYGTGKTLITRVAAKIAVDNGFTVIVIDRASALNSALQIAERHQPCLVIVEDLDMATKERGNLQNDLLLTMDGFMTKSNFDVIVLATSNDVNSIIEALLRPGRFDDVFRVSEPDRETAKAIIRHYAGNHLVAGSELETVAELMQGQSPASLAEVVRRAENAAIMLGREKISDLDLERAAESILDHLAIVNKNRLPAPESSLEKEFRTIIREEVRKPKGNGKTRHI